MSGRTEPPDWLDELYQEDNNEGPPASVDARIRAAAHGQLSARPWYLRARSLASAATIILGLGITALWMSEPDLAELAAPSTQGTSAELREAVQPKKRQLQTSASDVLREEDEIDASVSSIQASTPPPQAAAPAELKFQSETANAAADSEPEAANLSAARSPLASTADFDLSAGGGTEVARRATARSPMTDSDLTKAADLSEIREAPASRALPGSLQPDNCATLTLIDVGTATPYALCRLQDNQLRIHHPSCPLAFELSDQTINGDLGARSLIIVDQEERSQLTCNPETGTWMLQPLGATPLQ